MVTQVNSTKILDEKQAGEISAQFKRLLAHLGRGGAFGYWWTIHNDKKLTTWWTTKNLGDIPQADAVYFGVHPTIEHGSPHERGRIATIAAINCLFAELDAKDFAGSLGDTLTHVTTLQPPPSVIVKSGGGYHAYWLLRDPWPLDTPDDTEQAKELQARWVAYTGGDPGAKDLARVLRVPGSLNRKYDPPRHVGFVWADFEQLYTPDELAAYCGPQEAPQRPQKRRITADPGKTGEYWLQKALSTAHEGNRNDTGLWLFCQLRDAGLSQGQVEDIARAYVDSVPSDGYTESEAIKSVRSVFTRPPRSPAMGRGVAVATSNGRAPDLSKAPEESQATQPGDLTDTGNADRLVKTYGDRLRWVSEWGWLLWDGQRWQRDKSGLVMRCAKKTSRNIYREAAQAPDDERARSLASWAGKSLNKTRLDAMVALAQPELPARPGDFDADPYALNTENGIVDLRSGKLGAHDSGALVTKIAGTAFDAGAKCPTWLNFLNRIMGEDADMIAFLQRAIGYTLTGDVGEQALFFLYGTGANGKSTFIQALLSVMGEYGRQAAPQLLLSGDRHSTEIADLQGARFVATVEVEEGRRMAEVLVKTLTGGDRLKARFMRRDFFEFDPTFKIWLAANHKPVIRGTDYAIWRRIHLIPFDVTIPENERDPWMGDKLKAESVGILAWAIRGCLAWQSEGLAVPKKVKMATAAYQAEMDVVGGFLEDCCLIHDLASVTAGALYEAFKTWAEKSGEKLISHRRFSQRMTERGWSTNGRDAYGRALYSGLGLLEEGREDATNS